MLPCMTLIAANCVSNSALNIRHPKKETHEKNVEGILAVQQYIPS